MNQNPSTNLRMTVYSSLFTALVIIGGYLSFPIPVSPVPIVLSDFFVLLTGLFLGPAWGLMSIGLYIFFGALGLPVFAAGKAGLAVFFGPTGGYLLGFLACVFLAGIISGRGKPSAVKDLFALIVGSLVIYVFGVPWLKIMLNLTWGKALAAGFLPFIPGMLIKIVVALGLIKILRPRFKQTMYPGQQG